jgi:hypothetical protein
VRSPEYAGQATIVATNVGTIQLQGVSAPIVICRGSGPGKPTRSQMHIGNNTRRSIAGQVVIHGPLWST